MPQIALFFHEDVSKPKHISGALLRMYVTCHRTGQLVSLLSISDAARVDIPVSDRVG